MIEYNPGPVATAAHYSRARVKLFWGPVGTSKTSWLCWRVYGMARRAAKKGKSLRALLLRDTYRNLADSTLQTWLRWFPDGQSGRLVRSVPADFVFTTPDGREHTVLFRHGQTARDASDFLGTEYGFIGLEEVAPAYLPGKDAKVSPGIAEEVFQLALSRGSRVQDDIDPELAITCNPPSRSHWTSKLIIDRSGNERHGVIELADPVTGSNSIWEHWFTPTSENQANLRDTYYAELTAGWPRILVRRFVEGERIDAFVGIPRFDLDALDDMKRQHAKEPEFRGWLHDSPENVLHIKPEANANGWVRMWEYPKGGHEYVVGCDVAEGLEGGDYSSAHVLDRADLHIVAAWHGHCEPEKFGLEIAKLGRTYNQALVGVESNNHGLVTLVALKNAGYQRIYYQSSIDTRTRKTERIGWRTDMKTKPLLIDDLSNYLTSGGQVIDADTIQEMMTYGVNERGECEAQAACHDDRVISLAIAIQMSKFSGLERIFPYLGKKAVA